MGALCSVHPGGRGGIATAWCVDFSILCVCMYGFGNELGRDEATKYLDWKLKMDEAEVMHA